MGGDRRRQDRRGVRRGHLDHRVRQAGHRGLPRGGHRRSDHRRAHRAGRWDGCRGHRGESWVRPPVPLERPIGRRRRERAAAAHRVGAGWAAPSATPGGCRAAAGWACPWTTAGDRAGAVPGGRPAPRAGPARPGRAGAAGRAPEAGPGSGRRAAGRGSMIGRSVSTACRLEMMRCSPSPACSSPARSAGGATGSATASTVSTAAAAGASTAGPGDSGGGALTPWEAGAGFSATTSRAGASSTAAAGTTSGGSAMTGAAGSGARATAGSATSSATLSTGGSSTATARPPPPPASVGSAAALAATAFFVARLAGAGSAGCSARIRPSFSARRRTRSPCASSMLDECDFASMPSAMQRSRASLLVRPSSLASSWTLTFFGTDAVNLSSAHQRPRARTRRPTILSCSPENPRMTPGAQPPSWATPGTGAPGGAHHASPHVPGR